MSQNQFTSAIGGYILRGTNPIYVKNYEMAMALFKIQDENYKFTPVVQVHKSDNTCVSCEGWLPLGINGFTCA